MNRPLEHVPWPPIGASANNCPPFRCLAGIAGVADIALPEGD